MRKRDILLCVSYTTINRYLPNFLIFRYFKNIFASIDIYTTDDENSIYYNIAKKFDEIIKEYELKQVLNLDETLF